MIILLLAVDEQIRKKVNGLIAGVAQGDGGALDALYRLLSGKMLAVAFNICRHKQMSEDIVSDSFLRIVRYAETFKRGTNGYAWIMKLTQNTAYNRIKSENYRTGENLDDFYSLSQDFDEISHAENTVLLEGAMAGLEERERRCVYLKYYMDLTVRDIGERLEMSKSDVSRKIKSGEQKIRDYLASKGYSG